MIRAAGGVLWRPAQGAAGPVAPVEVAVVHRPRHDDWSLPKGKLAADEPALLGAAREVVEETGVTPQVQRRLLSTSYRVDGEAKTVDYWAMRAGEGEFAPNDEVDELRWMAPADAGSAVSYPADREVLDALLAAPCDTATVLLVRHGRAGSAQKWKGDDRLRPLDAKGRRQSAGIAEMLPVFRPSRVLAADRVRCVDTVRPLADRLGLEVEIEPAFSEESHAADPARGARLLRSLAAPGSCVVVGSQGGVIPDALSTLAEEDGVALATTDAAKGSVWALSLAADGRLVAADYYPPTTDRSAQKH